MDGAAPEFLRQLMRAEAFPHPVRELRLIETHISWLLLTGDWAYKLKKPLDLGFLDFSTLERRRFYCEEELRLNRRFAPQLYTGVCAVTDSSDGARLDGDGAVIDYAVKMRQFDQRDLFDAIAARGELDAALLRRLAQRVAQCHAALPPQPAARQPESFTQALRQNFAQVRDYPLGASEQEALVAVETWSERQLARLHEQQTQRCAEGWVRECHGDLHLGNIALWQGEICLFDCIEFNPAFRLIDTIAEIAFLCMDLQARGHDDLAVRLLNDYLEYRGDYAGLALFDLYRGYYAMVRAKVNLLRQPRARQLDRRAPGFDEFRRYLALAQGYGTPRRRFLALTYGVSGSGKSTVAMALAMRTGAIRLRSDVERKRLFGLAPEQPSDAAQRERIYAAATTRRVFERLEALARSTLDAGFPCVVDATFLHRRAREPFRQLAAALGVPFFILECRCPEPELLRRLQQRHNDASEADAEVMRQQQRQGDPLDGDEQAHVLIVDSSAPLSPALLEALGAGGA